MIRLKNLVKTYQNQTVLNNITHSFLNEKTTVLIGPSGCGKSTLIKLILGLEKKSQGKILVNDKALTESELTQFKYQTGYVTQGGGLFPHLTAFENITIMPHFFKWPKDRTQYKINEFSSLTHFSKDLLDKYPSQLSGGQKQRVSLMRSLILDPELILLDEPLGALDPMIRKDLQEELKAIFTQLNKTVILVTHDMGEAVYFADEIVLMNEGRIIQSGSAYELIHNPKIPFVTEFINAQRNPLDEL